MRKVRVTQAHISNGIKGSRSQCPIALAISDSVGLHVEVGDYVAHIGNDLYQQSDGIRYKVFMFDKRGHMKPFCVGIRELPRMVVVA